jgi:hypothetical protein
VLIALLAALTAQLAVAQQPGATPQQSAAPPRFMAIDVFVDSGTAALGAYQVEVKAVAGPGNSGAPAVTLVGVEGGEHAAYKQPPYYDPAALHENAIEERIVIAAFSTAASLPAGKTRVARLHLQVSGPEPSFAVRVQAAGAADGTRIEATATWAPADAGTGDRR